MVEQKCQWRADEGRRQSGGLWHRHARQQRDRIRSAPKATTSSRPAAGSTTAAPSGQRRQHVSFMVYTGRTPATVTAKLADPAATADRFPTHDAANAVASDLDVADGLRGDALFQRAADLEYHQYRHRSPGPRLGVRSQELSRPQRQTARGRPHPDPRRHRRRRQGRQADGLLPGPRHRLRPRHLRAGQPGDRLVLAERLRLHRRRRRRSADKKEVLFTKTGQPQHDHSAHAFVFGPDGKLYWNFGNAGHAVHDKNGKPIVDLGGQRQSNDRGKPYRDGMVFRCDLDGSHFEVLGLELPQQLRGGRRFASARSGSPTTTTTATAACASTT